MRYQLLKASELIELLQGLITEHGDLPVFSYADYEPIVNVSFERGSRHSGTPFEGLGDHCGIE